MAARDRLGTELAALSTGPERFGLIHADLHLANVMSDGRELTVIDFDDAGYGWFVHEIAVSLHPMLDDPRYDDALAAIVEGYRDVVPLGDADVALIDLFMTVRCLMIVGWLDARPEVPIYEFFPELAAQSEAQARRYLGR